MSGVRVLNGGAGAVAAVAGAGVVEAGFAHLDGEGVDLRVEGALVVGGLARVSRHEEAAGTAGEADQGEGKTVLISGYEAAYGLTGVGLSIPMA